MPRKSWPGAEATGYIGVAIGRERRLRLVAMAKASDVTVRNAVCRLVDRALEEGRLPDPRPGAERDLPPEA